ncbi:MAG: hypothetical protein ACK46O_06130 [Flavobacteriia bacterium]|jgi:hypothetical protein
MRERADNSIDKERIQSVVTTLAIATVIVAGVALMLRISKVMISDLKEMGL